MRRPLLLALVLVVLVLVVLGGATDTGKALVMKTIGYAWRSAYAGNFGGARTVPVDMLVIHTTESTKESALSWFAMDHGTYGPTSAHYVVGADGSVTQAVSEENVAWHAGNREVNARSIGIECEGFSAKPETWTPALLDALVALVAQLVSKYGIPVKHGSWNEPGIIGHRDVPGTTHTDPGTLFPWDAVLARVQAAGAVVA